MEKSFNAFASDYAHIFEGDFDDEDQEQKLEYMDVYKKYQELFEQMLETLIAKCGITQEDFAAAMQAPAQEGEDNVEKEQIIMVYGTLSDYDYFLKMMREYKNKYEDNGEEEGE